MYGLIRSPVLLNTCISDQKILFFHEEHTKAEDRDRGLMGVERVLGGAWMAGKQPRRDYDDR